jgi:hypothetical protein
VPASTARQPLEVSDDVFASPDFSRIPGPVTTAVCDVANELASGAASDEAPLHQVGHGRRGHRVGFRVGFRVDPDWSWLARHAARLAHHLPHQLGATLRLLLGQFCVDSAIPGGAVGFLEMVADLYQKGLAAGRLGRLKPNPPVGETRR